MLEWVADREPAVVGIDSPRDCARPGESSRAGERELVRAGICRIRWTPERSQLAGNPYYEWVENGLALYAALADLRTIEVFPTAAWTLWAGPRGGRGRGAWSRSALDSLHLAGLPERRLNQDDRDAAAALTARQYGEGRCREFGPIVVPDGRP